MKQTTATIRVLEENISLCVYILKTKTKTSRYSGLCSTALSFTVLYYNIKNVRTKSQK